jgi:hypothetical protein
MNAILGQNYAEQIDLKKQRQELVEMIDKCRNKKQRLEDEPAASEARGPQSWTAACGADG